ncbi:MAG: glucosaminidase domain-containing protein [Mariprofundaceae bacterium]
MLLTLPVGAASAANSEMPLPFYLESGTILEKKRVFFEYLKPIVMDENRRVSEQRNQILALKNISWTDEQRAWLEAIFTAYKVSVRLFDHQAWNQLLRRVDVVPVELVLAQAANESAWGSSRFAREGNNLFGQWCFTKGCGLVPKHRIPGAKHEVALFESHAASVRAYILNLNRNSAYEKLRRIRVGLKRMNKPQSAIVLAAGLEKYSERGKDYIQSIRAIIRSNQNLM